MSDKAICGRCRLPIHRDSPMQHFGRFVTHEPNECVRLLRAENERLRAAGVGYSQQTVDALTKDRDALQVEVDALRAENERLARARAIVNEQADDEGLWCPAATATEAYLQHQLRRLHAAVEGER